jgi:hypothetical protein
VFASKRTESAGSSSSRRLHSTLNWRERTRARRSPSHRTRLASREVVIRRLRSWRGGRPALRAPCRSEGQRMVTCISASGAAARESASLRRSCGHEAHGGSRSRLPSWRKWGQVSRSAEPSVPRDLEGSGLTSRPGTSSAQRARPPGTRGSRSRGTSATRTARSQSVPVFPQASGRRRRSPRG